MDSLRLNNNLSINYSTKFLNINDKNYSQHRLSSKRSLGTITSLGIYWEKDGLELGGNIGYQNLILDKANVSNGTIFSLFSSIRILSISHALKKSVYIRYTSALFTHTS